MTPANASCRREPDRLDRRARLLVALEQEDARQRRRLGLGLFERGPARGVTPSQLVQIEVLGRFGSDPEPMRIRNRLDDLGRSVEHQRVVCPHAAPATVQAVRHRGLPRLGPAAERNDAVLHDHGAGMDDLLAVSVQRHREHSALIRVLDDGARDRRRSGLGNYESPPRRTIRSGSSLSPARASTARSLRHSYTPRSIRRGCAARARPGRRRPTLGGSIESPADAIVNFNGLT